jgi:hypothetical protein
MIRTWLRRLLYALYVKGTTRERRITNREALRANRKELIKIMKTIQKGVNQ